MRLSLGLAALLALAGCGDKDGDPGATDDTGPQGSDGGGDGGGPLDADGDGVPAGEDCDDEDAEVHPDATEVCDGVDNDCDGSIDDEDPSLDPASTSAWYEDQDGDGYGTGEALSQACAGGEGTAARTGDCDDQEPAMSPGLAEDCNDGLDNDCDGGRNECGSWGELDLDDDQDTWIVANQDGAKMAGLHQVSHGDFDGDGRDDLVLGSDDYGYAAYGRVWVFEGTIPRGYLDTDDADTTVSNDYGYYELGASVSGGYDGDRDGYDDLVVGVPGIANAVVLFDGPLSGSHSTDAVWGYWAGGDSPGRIVLPAELDGDGHADLLMVGDQAIYGVAGSLGSDGPVGNDVTHVVTVGLPDQVVAADLDGDGTDELVLGLHEEGVGGEVWLVGGDLSEVVAEDVADRVVGPAGAITGEDLVVADLDEDGHLDLLVEDGTGDLALLLGPLDGAREVAAEPLRIRQGEDWLRTFVALDDFTGDGHVDLVAGVVESASTLVHVLAGPFPDGAEAADAVATITGSAGGLTGQRLTSAGDVDGDGTEDLLVADPGADNGENGDAGAVHIFRGGGL